MVLRKGIFFIAFFTGIILFVYSYSSAGLPPASHRWLNEARTPQPGDRILVFSPHPDDETIAVGGYINRAAQAGAEVKIVLVTDGNKHGLIEERYKEFHKATETLGVSSNQLSFWGYPDGRLRLCTDSLEGRLNKEIKEFNPTILIYPHPADRHPDHAVLGREVEIQLYQNIDSSPLVPYRYLVHHRHFPQRGLVSRRDTLLPPLGLSGLGQRWHSCRLTPQEKAVKEMAMDNYNTQLRNPFLRSLLHNLLRDNELLEFWDSSL